MDLAMGSHQSNDIPSDPEVPKPQARLQADHLIECSCCCETDFSMIDMSACPEGHIFCKICIRRYTEIEIGDGKTKIKCMDTDCSEEFSIPVLKELLHRRLFDKLMQTKQMEEVMAAKIEGFVSCPFCEFGFVLDPEDTEFHCQNPSCMKKSCRKCRELSHIPLKCDEVEKDKEVQARKKIEDRMTQVLLRECWNCKKKFVKVDGCNKMVCTCGAKMCYICRQRVENYKHFSDLGLNGTCPLWTNNDDLHVTAVVEEGAKALEELKNEDPTLNLKHDPTKIAPVPERANLAHHQLHHGDQFLVPLGGAYNAVHEYYVLPAGYVVLEDRQVDAQQYAYQGQEVDHMIQPAFQQGLEAAQQIPPGYYLPMLPMQPVMYGDFGAPRRVDPQHQGFQQRQQGGGVQYVPVQRPEPQYIFLRRQALQLIDNATRQRQHAARLREQCHLEPRTCQGAQQTKQEWMQRADELMHHADQQEQQAARLIELAVEQRQQAEKQPQQAADQPQQAADQPQQAADQPQQAADQPQQDAERIQQDNQQRQQAAERIQQDNQQRQQAAERMQQAYEQWRQQGAQRPQKAYEQQRQQAAEQIQLMQQGNERIQQDDQQREQAYERIQQDYQQRKQAAERMQQVLYEHWRQQGAQRPQQAYEQQRQQAVERLRQAAEQLEQDNQQREQAAERMQQAYEQRRQQAAEGLQQAAEQLEQDDQQREQAAERMQQAYEQRQQVARQRQQLAIQRHQAIFQVAQQEPPEEAVLRLQAAFIQTRQARNQIRQANVHEENAADVQQSEEQFQVLRAAYYNMHK